MRRLDPEAINLIVVHCSGTKPNADVGIEEFRHYHVDIKGWDDVAYHKCIRRDGTIEEGRSEEYQGAHCIPVNNRSLALVMVGGLGEDMAAELNFTDEQYESLKDVLASWMESYPRIRESSHPVLGHSDLEPQRKPDCPGFPIRAWYQDNG